MQPSPAGAQSRALSLVSLVLFVAMHASAFLVLLVHFSWKLVVLAFASYLVRMWAVTAGYHRYFSHRAFKTSRAFQLVLAVLGTTAMQNGPLWWASWHRRHHKHADTPQDLHSPAHGGFWNAHLGWFMRGGHDDPDLTNVRDLTRYPELRFLERHKWFSLVAYAFACFAIAGLPGVAWGFCLSTIVVFHATLLINSLAHVWGSRTFDTGDTSRNNFLLAVVTMGEGWHNNHHHYPSSVRQGFRWWQIDLTYWTVRALSALGIVWGVREPPPSVTSMATSR